MKRAGSPPAWTPPKANPQLQQDKGAVFRDVNSARYPSFPMEPAVRSIFTMKPDFEFGRIDIFGCGSTFGNLFRLDTEEARPFRFQVDVVDGIIFLLRHEKSPMEMIKDLRGYGHTFPEAYTTWDSNVANSCSHQRIIKYNFGGIDIMIRTETDAYIKSERIVTSASASLNTLGDLSLSRAPSHGKLELRNKGTEIPQSQIFDIKTRRVDTVFDMEEIYPRLWLNQTPNFLIAYHTFGKFDSPHVKDIKQDIQAWEEYNTTRIERYHALLLRIMDVARDHDQCEVYWSGDGPLLIYEQEDILKKAIPDDLRMLISHELEAEEEEEGERV